MPTYSCNAGRSSTITSEAVTETPQHRLAVQVSLPFDLYAVLITVIVLGQAGLLGVFASRGWFYGDDLSYLSQATGRTLGWGYLTGSLNDHFVPGLRFVFWLLDRTTKLNYGITIPARMLLQAGTTLLLYRLLVLLVGRRPGVLLVLAWYAFGPLLMPGSVWLTTSVHLMSAQILVILAIDLHVRYSVSGRIVLAAGSTGCLLGAMLFWELSGITALLLPIISLGFVHSGSLRQRLGQSLRRWPGWLILGAVLAGWLAVFLSGPYGGSAHPFGLSAALQVLRVGWLDALAPALIGGPWRWFYYGDVYFPVADPPVTAVVLAQLCVLAVLLVALRRTGWRALLAWLLPLLTFAIGTITVSVGRFWAYGDLSPRAFNYAFILAVPAALGAALSLLPSNPALVAARAGGDSSAGARALPGPADWRGTRTWVRAALAVAIVALLVSNLLTDARFIHRWSQNPSKKYVDTLTASVRAAGPQVNLWDGQVPQSVLTFLSSGNHISDVLRLAGVPARFEQPGSDPMIVKADGTLAPAGLFPVAKGVQRPDTPCTLLVQGTGSWTIPLSATPQANEYFAKISYLQQKPSILNITLRDRSGALLQPVGGQRTQFDDRLGNVYFRLPLGSPTAVIVRSDNLDSAICIGAVSIGVPFPLQGK